MSILYSNIDLKKINYESPVKNGSFYYSSINYKNKPLHIQSPRMICKQSGEESILKNNPTLETETLNNDFSFYDFLLNLDDRNIKETFKKNEEWFQKKIPLEIIDDMYKRTIKPVKKDSKPNFAFKLPIIKGKVQCHIYDQKKICQDIQKIVPECEMVFILHIRGLKFLKQHYYCDCYISQIKVFLSNEDKYNILNQYMIEDDETKQEDNDIVDEEIIAEILKEKEIKNKKEETKNNLQQQILKLQQELDNL
tara:strand:- start:2377 stop:3132 length:756 start_codon:yes stop_codon:yes gene_type:complete